MVETEVGGGTGSRRLDLRKVRTKLTTYAFKFGHEVGYHRHDDFSSWAGEHKDRLIEAAAKVGVLEEVEEGYLNGKRSGASDRASDDARLEAKVTKEREETDQMSFPSRASASDGGFSPYTEHDGLMHFESDGSYIPSDTDGHSQGANGSGAGADGDVSAEDLISSSVHDHLRISSEEPGLVEYKGPSWSSPSTVPSPSTTIKDPTERRKPSTPSRVIPASIPGMDEMLGGGIPECSVLLFTGEDGTSKEPLTIFLGRKLSGALGIPVTYLSFLDDADTIRGRWDSHIFHTPHPPEIKVIDFKGGLRQLMNLGKERQLIRSIGERIMRRTGPSGRCILVVDPVEALLGLHISSNRYAQFLDLMTILRDTGSTIILVNHDERIIEELLTGSHPDLVDGILTFRLEGIKLKDTILVKATRMRGLTPSRDTFMMEFSEGEFRFRKVGR